MILFNKLVRIDLVMLIALLCLRFMKAGPVRDGVLGFAAATFLISLFSHIRHYKLYKKFY